MQHDLEAGDTIKLEVEQISSSCNRNIGSPDQKTSGNYIIQSLCHFFEDGKICYFYEINKRLLWNAFL